MELQNFHLWPFKDDKFSHAKAAALIDFSYLSYCGELTVRRFMRDNKISTYAQFDDALTCRIADITIVSFSGLKYKHKKEIMENTRLISIMYVNNELGTINPISEIASISHKKGILFHSDAVQTLGKIYQTGLRQFLFFNDHVNLVATDNFDKFHQFVILQHTGKDSITHFFANSTIF